MYRAERLPTMDLYGMLKYVRAGKSNRYVADNLQVDRRTVGKYRKFFEAEGLVEGELIVELGPAAGICPTCKIEVPGEDCNFCPNCGQKM